MQRTRGCKASRMHRIKNGNTEDVPIEATIECKRPIRQSNARDASKRIHVFCHCHASSLR